MAEQKIVEGWLAASKSRFWIENRLATHGVPADEVGQLIDSAEAAFRAKKRRRLVIFRCVGVAMLVAGGGLSIWGLFFVEGWAVMSGAALAVALVGLIVTLEPSALVHFNSMFHR